MQKIFEPFQDSSGFSNGVSKTSDKVPKTICFAINAVLDFDGLTDLEKQLHGLNRKLASVTRTFTAWMFLS